MMNAASYYCSYCGTADPHRHLLGCPRSTSAVVAGSPNPLVDVLRLPHGGYQVMKPAPDANPEKTDGPDERRSSLPEDADKRNEFPMADGLLDYFPNALAEVARLSLKATQQHHPDKGMHWDRGKSTDHRNKIMRHLVDAGLKDDKGERHSTMVAWRALANLQVELEQDEGYPPSRASRNLPKAA